MRFYLMKSDINERKRKMRTAQSNSSKIVNENNIDFTIYECTFEGDYTGTCQNAKLNSIS